MATASLKLIQSWYDIYVSQFDIPKKYEECSIHIIVGVITVLSFTAFYRLNVSYMVLVTIATVHSILLKPLLRIPKYVLGQNNFYRWQNILNVWKFSNIRLGHNHLRRHLEYLQLLKGDNSTPP